MQRANQMQLQNFKERMYHGKNDQGKRGPTKDVRNGEAHYIMYIYMYRSNTYPTSKRKNGYNILKIGCCIDSVK